MKDSQVKNDFFGILIDLPAEVFFMWNLNLTFQMEPDSWIAHAILDLAVIADGIYYLDGETEAQSIEVICPMNTEGQQQSQGYDSGLKHRSQPQAAGPFPSAGPRTC